MVSEERCAALGWPAFAQNVVNVDVIGHFLELAEKCSTLRCEVFEQDVRVVTACFLDLITQILACK
jgi:hypothetical protein